MRITSLPSSCLLVFRRRRGARGIARFDPRGCFGELFRNFAQELRRAFFRFRRNLFFYKTLHARELFVDAPAKVFKVFHVLKARKLFVNALAELFEFVHDWWVLAKIFAQRRSAATWVL